MTPEDKAPDMPDVITAWFNDDGTFNASPTQADGMFPLRSRCGLYTLKDTLPIQSPDQGAVEAFKRYNMVTMPFTAEEHAAILQALTRTPLDLNGVYSEVCKTYKMPDGSLPNSDVVKGVGVGIRACLSHLQAIRPDLFGK